MKYATVYKFNTEKIEYGFDLNLNRRKLLVDLTIATAATMAISVVSILSLV